MSEKPGPLNIDQVGKSVPELVSMGCKFTVEGDVFSAVNELLEKLLLDGAADPAGEQFLIQLRTALLTTSVPVISKVSGRPTNIKIASTIPRPRLTRR